MQTRMKARAIAGELYQMQRLAYTPDDLALVLGRHGLEYSKSRWNYVKTAMEHDGFIVRPINGIRDAIVHPSVTLQQWERMKARMYDDAVELPRRRDTLALWSGSQRLHDALKKIVVRAEAALPMEAPFWDWKAVDLPF